MSHTRYIYIYIYIYIYLFIDPFSEFIPELLSIIVAVRDQTICMNLLLDSVNFDYYILLWKSA